MIIDVGTEVVNAISVGCVIAVYVLIILATIKAIEENE